MKFIFYFKKFTYFALFTKSGRQTGAGLEAMFNSYLEINWVFLYKEK